MKSPYGLPCIETCLSCTLRSDDFFCALSEESLKAFNQRKHAAVFSGKARSFLWKGRPRVESSCSAKGWRSSPPPRVREKPSSCGSQSREKSSVYI